MTSYVYIRLLFTLCSNVTYEMLFSNDIFFELISFFWLFFFRIILVLITVKNSDLNNKLNGTFCFFFVVNKLCLIFGFPL